MHKNSVCLPALILALLPLAAAPEYALAGPAAKAPAATKRPMIQVLPRPCRKAEIKIENGVVYFSTDQWERTGSFWEFQPGPGPVRPDALSKFKFEAAGEKGFILRGDDWSAKFQGQLDENGELILFATVGARLVGMEYGQSDTQNFLGLELGNFRTRVGISWSIQNIAKLNVLLAAEENLVFRKDVTTGETSVNGPVDGYARVEFIVKEKKRTLSLYSQSGVRNQWDLSTGIATTAETDTIPPYYFRFGIEGTF